MKRRVREVKIKFFAYVEKKNHALFFLKDGSVFSFGPIRESVPIVSFCLEPLRLDVKIWVHECGCAVVRGLFWVEPLSPAVLVMFVVSLETRWVSGGPAEDRGSAWWQKERAGLVSVWQRDPVQTLFCSLRHEAQLVRKTALLSIRQYWSVWTVAEETDACTQCMKVFMLQTRAMWPQVRGRTCRRSQEVMTAAGEGFMESVCLCTVNKSSAGQR